MTMEPRESVAGGLVAGEVVEASMVTLERNLRLMQMRSSLAAKVIAETPASEHARIVVATDGSVTGTLVVNGVERQLASARGPRLEATRLADTVNLKESALVAVRGFGVGTHIELLSERMGRSGVVVCFEPDVALLRAVLERVDFTAMFSRFNVVIVTSADDTGAMSDALHGLEGLVAAGVAIVDHPPSRSRLGSASETFAKTLLTVVQAARTNVVTTLVQVEQTMMNYMGNVRAYATCPGINDLRDAAKGRAAVVVAAGPSLRKNVHLLKDASVRARVVVVAVQTVLKQLLAMGIKPDFVCALDYHEISTRFYEGLTAEDVEGVTLVVEPKASPAILRAFPGAIRCVGDDVLNKMLGTTLTQLHDELPNGATVAHLCYYLARYIGCEPVALIGQDLGFTDHQYYSPGAAIHQVWANELGEFRTLETMEFERIMRMRGWLRKLEGADGRTIFSDEQMHTYLLQFERDFLRDSQRQLTVIDATEGGVRKQHTTVMALAEFLRTHAQGEPIALPPVRKNDLGFDRALTKRLRTLRDECTTLQRVCDETMTCLKAMRDVTRDERKMNELVERVHAAAARIQQLDAHWLVQRLSQNGQLKRFKADREIALSSHESLWDENRQRIERDLINVEIIRTGAVRMDELLADAEHIADGAPLAARTGSRVSSLDDAAPLRHVAAMVWVDCERGSLLTKRDLRERVGSESVLSATLTRLEACAEIERIVLLTADAAQVAALLREHRLMKPTEIVEVAASRVHERLRGVKAARLWQRHSWRGGVNGLTVFDELFEPTTLARVMREREIDAVALVGADWVALHPSLMDAAIARYRSDPAQNRLTFSQAAAGLCGCVVDCAIVDELAVAKGPWATIGAIVGYHPHAPKNDPIAKDPCVKVHASVRDVVLRCVWDDANFCRVWRQLSEEQRWASPEELAAQLDDVQRQFAENGELVAECVEIDVTAMTSADVAAITREIRKRMQQQPALAVTIRDAKGEGPSVLLADAARAIGVAAVHLRLGSNALSEGTPLLDALDMGVDAISVDLPGDSDAAWRDAGAGVSREQTWDAMQAFLDERAKRIVNVPTTWLVPRMQKRDATLDDLESFMDRWLLTAGACVIDATTRADRVEPLPVPDRVRQRMTWAKTVLTVSHDTIRATAAVRPALPSGAVLSTVLEQAI
ncbi:MAG TPA: 6-hydroxymethylpterin diphosphokinase MptE-like protein [Phycisphaerales bacterium]|nr:6-hydroxymethylpterin diphosphokinase MptE-like protein [Phycisphaerales bacterium]